MILDPLAQTCCMTVSVLPSVGDLIQMASVRNIGLGLIHQICSGKFSSIFPFCSELLLLHQASCIISYWEAFVCSSLFNNASDAGRPVELCSLTKQRVSPHVIDEMPQIFVDVQVAICRGGTGFASDISAGLEVQFLSECPAPIHPALPCFALPLFSALAAFCNTASMLRYCTE